MAARWPGPKPKELKFDAAPFVELSVVPRRVFTPLTRSRRRGEACPARRNPPLRRFFFPEVKVLLKPRRRRVSPSVWSRWKITQERRQLAHVSVSSEHASVNGKTGRRTVDRWGRKPRIQRFSVVLCLIWCSICRRKVEIREGIAHFDKAPLKVVLFSFQRILLFLPTFQ